MKSKFIAITLVLTVAILMTVPVHADSAQPQLRIDIQRTVYLGTWGAVHIVDNFTVYNPGPAAATSLDAGFLQNFQERHLLCTS